MEKDKDNTATSVIADEIEREMWRLRAERRDKSVAEALYFLLIMGGDKSKPYLHKIARIIGSNKQK